MNWVFMALTNLLIYKQISIRLVENQISQGIYWKLIVIYSSIIILVNISYVFWIQWEILKQEDQEGQSSQTASDWFPWLPNWMTAGDNLVTLIGLIDYDGYVDEVALYLKFLPYLVYFCLSIYCNG